MYRRLLRSVVAIALSGRTSRRALATAAKLAGRRLERRWPFLPKAEGRELNLGFEDLLEFQAARSSCFTALVVGAYDGAENDPAGDFLRTHQHRAVFVESQPEPFRLLSERMRGRAGVETVNAAIDEVSGTRVLYRVPPGTEGLPAWTGQLASFSRDHLVEHEDRAPGLSDHIEELHVKTLSFDELLSEYQLDSLDLLQIDTEGMDAQLLAWFPFEVVRPALLHYEIVHMSEEEQRAVRQRLKALGYSLFLGVSPTDDMAILI